MESKNQRTRVWGELPWVTIFIIVACTVVTVLARRGFTEVALDYGLIPSNLHIGSFIAASFIHDGYVHLAINMSLLYLFGSGMERAMGRLEFAMFYIGACVASALLHVAIVYASLPPYYADQVVVGASGAIAGVIGLYAVRYHRRMFKLESMEI